MDGYIYLKSVMKPVFAKSNKHTINKVHIERSSYGFVQEDQEQPILQNHNNGLQEIFYKGKKGGTSDINDNKMELTNGDSRAYRHLLRGRGICWYGSRGIRHNPR